MLVKLTNGNKLSDEEAKKVTAGDSIFCVIFLAMSDWDACGDPVDPELTRFMVAAESKEH